MAKVLSCGVIGLNMLDEVLLCHATGTPRWDIPKGLSEPGETPLQTAVRETWEETSLQLDPLALLDLGVHSYLPAKALHLFAVGFPVDAFSLRQCRCQTHFLDRTTGLATPEVDAYAWVPIQRLAERCGKNLLRVLQALDWPSLTAMPQTLPAIT